MRAQLNKLILGKPNSKSRAPVQNSLLEHLQKIKLVWHGELYEDFGIERVFRLFLISAKLLFPGIYLQWLFGKGEYLATKLTGEFYVYLKTLLPLFILIYGGNTIPVFQVLNVYMLAETLIYIFNKIYVSEHEEETAHKRSILLLFFNYVEVILAFAVIYSGGNYLNITLNHYIDAIYFSTVSGATIGYGDIYPVTNAGKLIVICQTFTSLSFIVLFFNYFGSKIRR